MLKYMDNSIPAYLNLPVPKIGISSKLQLNFFKTVSSLLNVKNNQQYNLSNNECDYTHEKTNFLKKVSSIQA